MAVPVQDEAVRTAHDAAPSIVPEPAHQAPGRASWFLPSLTDVAFLAPVVILFRGLKGAHTLLGDGDTGWHLRTGEWILANGRVPDRDMFSYTRPGHEWFAWEWLWDVIFAWLHGLWGMAGVLVASTTVIAATAALLFLLARWKSGNPLLAIAAVLVASFGSSIHWLARPHLFTPLFVVIFYLLLERAQTGKTRALVWLPILTVLWTNLHGGFIVGILLIGGYAAGEFAGWLINTDPDARAEAWKRSRRYAIVASGCLAASIVNPYGYQLHAHIVRYLSEPFLYKSISEFRSMDFQHPVGPFVEGIIVLGAVAAAWNIYNRRFAYPILFAVWMHLSLASARNLPIFLIITAPVVAEFLVYVVARVRESELPHRVKGLVAGFSGISQEIGAIDSRPRVPIFPVVVVAGVALLFHLQPGTRFQPAYDAKRFPSAAADALGHAELAKGLFTSDVWGGYLIYRMHPEFRAFIDGRSDFYGVAFENKYMDVYTAKWNWRTTLDEYGVRTVLLPVGAPLVGTLKQTAQWRAIYDDGVAIAFRRASAGSTAAQPGATTTQDPAIDNDGGLTAIARSRTLQPVIEDHNPTRGDN